MITEEQFTKTLVQQLSRSVYILSQKQEEYSTEDLLHNFRVAAALEGVSLKEACAGFMAKHTVSIFDMCKSKKIFSQGQWDEKITDHINYLLLLRCIVEEDYIHDEEEN